MLPGMGEIGKTFVFSRTLQMRYSSLTASFLKPFSEMFQPKVVVRVLNSISDEKITDPLLSFSQEKKGFVAHLICSAIDTSALSLRNQFEADAGRQIKRHLSEIDASPFH